LYYPQRCFVGLLQFALDETTGGVFSNGCCDGDFFGKGEGLAAKNYQLFNVANKLLFFCSRDLAVDIVNHSPF
jgi:hypothetical protein